MIEEQMKRLATLALALAILAAPGGPAIAADPAQEAKPVFSEFHSKIRAFPLTFKYPKEWKLEEEKGQVEKYHTVRLLGPRNTADTHTAYISITGTPVEKKGGKFKDLSEIVRNYKEHQFSGSKVEQEKVTVVAGHGAVDLTISSVIPPIGHKGLKPAETPVRTRTLFTQKGDTLYRITYSADTRVYGRHLKKFDQLLETLQFE